MIKQKIKYALNGLIKRGYWYNNILFPDSRKFYRYDVFNTKVINLGSTSAVNAFNYAGLNIKAANWAMGRNPLRGDLSILKNYVSYLDQKGSAVIIALCPFTSLSGSYDYLDDRYYPILYPTMIPNYTFHHNLMVQNKWSNPVLHYPWYALFLDIYRLIVKKSYRTMSEEELKRDADVKIKSWCHEFSLHNLESPLSLRNKDGIEDAITLLKEIIAYVRLHNGTPYIVVPPMYKSLGGYFTPELTRKYINIITDSVPDVKFINYTNDPEFCQNRSLFRDSYLMNEKGAKLFTKRVLKDLNILE